MTSLRRQIGNLIRDLDPTLTTARMILLCGLLYGGANWYYTLPFTFLACLGLLYKKALLHEGFWFAVLLVVALTCVLDWYIEGNQIFLLTYACACFFIACLFKVTTILPEMVRVLIGATFLMSVVAKLASPDFLSGGFLYLGALRDETFRVLNGFMMPAEVVSHNEVLFPGRYYGPIFQGTVSLQTLDNLLAWVRILSAFLVLLESLIALAFVLPETIWLARSRDVVLCGFMFAVYVLLPVPSFATLFAALGFLQAASSVPRFTYLIIFFLAQFHFLRLDLVA